MSWAALMENNTHIRYRNHVIMATAPWSQNTHVSIHQHTLDIHQNLTASICKIKV